MTLTRFYRLALVLPVLVPALAWPFAPHSTVATFLAFSLFFGGVGYLIFYVAMFWVLGRLTEHRSIIRLIWFSPFIFVPFQILGILLYVAYSKLQDPDVRWDLFVLPGFALYDLIFGYVYVSVVEALRKLVFHLPSRPDMRSNQRLQGDGSPAARRA